MSEKEQKKLDCSLTTKELAEAIQSMQSGKAPGPDGFPIEFYMRFEEKLLAPLLDMFKEFYIKGILPPSLRLAIITLILKPNKPPNECSCFRPISLMGCDIKILDWSHIFPISLTMIKMALSKIDMDFIIFGAF